MLECIFLLWVKYQILNMNIQCSITISQRRGIKNHQVGWSGIFPRRMISISWVSSCGLQLSWYSWTLFHRIIIIVFHLLYFLSTVPGSCTLILMAHCSWVVIDHKYGLYMPASLKNKFEGLLMSKVYWIDVVKHVYFQDEPISYQILMLKSDKNQKYRYCFG